MRVRMIKIYCDYNNGRRSLETKWSGDGGAGRCFPPKKPQPTKRTNQTRKTPQTLKQTNRHFCLYKDCHRLWTKGVPTVKVCSAHYLLENRIIILEFQVWILGRKITSRVTFSTVAAWKIRWQYEDGLVRMCCWSSSPFHLPSKTAVQ